MSGSTRLNFDSPDAGAFARLPQALILCVWVGGLLAGTSRVRAADLPKTEDVLASVAERSKTVQQLAPKYEFTRTKRTKVVDGDGNVENLEEEVYRVVPGAGRHYARLMAKDGKPISESQRLKQQEDERKFRESGNARKGPKDDSMFKFLDTKTASRFEYKVIGRDEIRNRPAYVLSIKPRNDVPVHGMAEKVMARMEGRFWVDADEWEVARVEARLVKPFRFVFGAVGVLHEFEFGVERRRLEDGEWANAELRVLIHFRQLFETKTVTYGEIASDYKLTGGIGTAFPPSDAGRP